MSGSFETIIIGGGQGGLSTSYHLKQLGREHIVLEQAAQAGNAWRNDRWDSFTLVTPNWSFRLPGMEYQGDAPDGFMPRSQIVASFERYVERFQLPVQYETQVSSVEPRPDGRGFWLTANGNRLDAENVVVATGLFQTPKRPAFHSELDRRITQLHSGQYRNPQALPPGAVLVVGSAQSGCQIAEELYQSGRQVYLCVGSAGRAPRRYRGKDMYDWLYRAKFLERTVEQLPSPKARFAGNPQLSGRDGGHSLNLHQFARDGVILLGRLQAGRQETIWLAEDLNENLAKADKFESEIVKLVDAYIERSGLDAAPESLPVLRDGYRSEQLSELDLKAAAVCTIIWAIGYRFDFSLVNLPLLDGDGFPIQRRGVTDHPGLFFAGMPWMDGQATGLLLGVGEQAGHIASAINARNKR